MAVKLDPSGGLLQSFIELNNLALARFSAADRLRIGVHTCPGGDPERVLEIVGTALASVVLAR